MNLYFRCTFESSAIDFFLFSVLLHNGPLCKRSGTQTGHIRLDASATTEHFSLNLGLYGGIVSRHWSVVSCVRGVSVGAGLGFPVGACAMLRFAPPTSDKPAKNSTSSYTLDPWINVSLLCVPFLVSYFYVSYFSTYPTSMRPTSTCPKSTGPTSTCPTSASKCSCAIDDMQWLHRF